MTTDDPACPLAALPGRRLHPQGFRVHERRGAARLAAALPHDRCPRRDASGMIVNGVLLLQGNTGTGANWLRPRSPTNCTGRARPWTPSAIS